MLCSITPLIQYAPLYAFLPESAFFRQKAKKGPLSGIEPRTTDISDARDATTAIGSIFFTPAATSYPRRHLHPALALLLLLYKRDLIIRSGL